MRMKLHTRSEWLRLKSPIAEPEVKWNRKEPYFIERVIRQDGSIVWFGQAVNWVKEVNGDWTVLTTNENAKPLEKYLPDIVYGEDRTYFKKCKTPIYEELYIKLQKFLHKKTGK